MEWSLPEIKTSVTLGNFSGNPSCNFVRIQCTLQDLRLETCFTVKRLLQHVSLGWWKQCSGLTPQQHKLEEIIPLDDATECCDTSCRDDVTLCNNWKFYCSIVRGIAHKKTDFFFSSQLQQQKIARNVCSRVCYNGQFFLATCAATKLQTNCTSNSQV